MHQARRGGVVGGAAPAARRNVVLIILDDLRPELPGVAYNCSEVVAPAMASLAASSVAFRRAYAQEALCAPSRNSFLSGRRPDETRAWQFVDDFREVGPDWTTLPGAFKRAGYETVGAGKVFHPGLPPAWDMPYSWDDRMNNSVWEPWLYPSEPECPGRTSYCAVAVDDDEEDPSQFEDTQTSAQLAKLLANVTAPYFLAAGFRKPHLQWRFPSRYWPATAGAGTSPHKFAPIDAPGLSYHMPYSELSGLADFEACGGAAAMSPSYAYPDECQRLWRRAYFASVAFVDSQIAALLRRVDDDAIVAVCGDHGWHLGDLAEWEKFTNFENAVRVPLTIRANGILDPAIRSDPVELLDLYPTLAALAGIDLAYTDRESVPLAGRDLFRLEPSRPFFARSQFPRCVGAIEYDDDAILLGDDDAYPAWYLNDCNDVPSRLFTHMGYSIRDDSWRFTAWFEWDGAAARPPAVALELYDHRLDNGTCPDAFDGPFETRNLAPDPAYRAVVARLYRDLLDLFHIRHDLADLLEIDSLRSQQS